MHQSCRRYCTWGVARPLAWSQATMRCLASRHDNPLNSPELTSTPSSVTLGSGSPVRTTSRIGSLNRSEEHTSELQSQSNIVCRLLPEKKKIMALNLTHTNKPKY